MTIPKHAKLILVSNRLPLKKIKVDGKTSFAESDGGLVSSLKSYFERAEHDRFGEKIWVGAADFSEQKWKKFTKTNQASSAYKIEPLFVDDKVFGKFYDGFCNALIWPLFHYFPSFAEYEDDAFA